MTLWHQVSATVTVVVITTLAFPAAYRLGRHSIDQWLSPEERDHLQPIGRAWWVIALAAGALVSWHSLLSPAANAPAMSAGWLGQHAFIGAFVALLVALTRIDLTTRLLPDPLTAGLVLSGLLFHWLFETGQLLAGIQGAALGYGLLWLLARLFEWLRGQEAMGRGDFFMAAGLGAWLGWKSLPMILMLASLSALIVAVVMRFVQQSRQQQGGSALAPTFFKQEIPFGPALAFGGLATWVLHHG